MSGSWITTLLGYVIITLDLAKQAFVDQGLPNTLADWITFATGIVAGLIGVFAKDFNKTGPA